jgi:hypothetical protein
MKKIVVIILLLGLISCSNTEDPNKILPDIPVNVTLYLNNPSNNRGSTKRNPISSQAVQSNKRW